MLEKNSIWNDSIPNMDMSEMQYRIHCQEKRKLRSVCMCQPLSKIRYMSSLELLEYCGQKDAIPLDLGTMLNKLGVSCLAFDFTEIENEVSAKTGNKIESILGALVVNQNNAAIFYRHNDKPESHRHRFTIAHEIAHCCLGHFDISAETSVHLRQEGDPSDDNEKAANIFAGELLIPEHSLRRVIKELILPSVITLANVFAVSENVMRARLEHLRICDNIFGYNS